MLEWLELILSGCMGETALNSNNTESLNENDSPCYRKVTLEVVVGQLEHAPFNVFRKLESRVSILLKDVKAA